MRKHAISFNILVLCIVFCLPVTIPHFAFAQADSGIELYQAGDYKNAESKLRETLKSEPRNTTVRYYLGLSLMSQGKFPEALKELKTVKNEQGKSGRESSPAVPNVYQIDLALAQTNIELGQYEEAWPELESARTIDPDSSEVYLYRGIYYYKQKDYSKAIKELEKSVSFDPQKAYAYYYLGMVYSETKKPDKMVEAFKMFLKLAPDAPEAPDVQERVAAAC